MAEYYDEQLDLTKNRITEIEKNISIIQDNLTTLAEEIKQTQYFIMKLAKNQSEITKRVSQWPYIAVPYKDEGE
jgi:prefoldin subunit 5